MQETINCPNSDCRASGKIKKECAKKLIVNNGNGRGGTQSCSYNPAARFIPYFDKKTKRVRKITRWINS